MDKNKGVVDEVSNAYVLEGQVLSLGLLLSPATCNSCQGYSKPTQFFLGTTVYFVSSLRYSGVFAICSPSPCHAADFYWLYLCLCSLHPSSQLHTCSYFPTRFAPAVYLTQNVELLSCCSAIDFSWKRGGHTTHYKQTNE